MSERSVYLGQLARAHYMGGMSIDVACEKHVKVELTPRDKQKIERNIRLAKISNNIADRLADMRQTRPPYGLVQMVQDSPFLDTRRLTAQTLIRYETVVADPDLTTKQPDHTVPNNYMEILERFRGYLHNTLDYALIEEAIANPDDFKLPGASPDPVRHNRPGFGTAAEGMKNTLATIFARHVFLRDALPTYGFMRCFGGRSLGILNRLAGYHMDNSRLSHQFFDDGYDHYWEQQVIDLDFDRQCLDVIEPAYSQSIDPMLCKRPMGITTGCPARVSLPNAHGSVYSPIQRVYRHYLDAVA